MPFEERYKSLNAAQREAVDSIEGPIMVVAGPGTGKTTILTLRIANILRRTDTPAHGILAITYTDAGVKAIRTKLHDVIGNRAHEVNIHTFHSFASAIIAEYQNHFLHIDGMRRMTDVEQESLIRSIISDSKFKELRPIGKPDAYIAAVTRSIDDVKREAVTPAMVMDHALKEIKRVKSDPDSVSSRGASKGKLKAEVLEHMEKCRRTMLFADVYEHYEEEKRNSKRMDFNDLIIELLVALRNDSLLLRLIQERFLYLMVDEHQDTNDAQNFIIALIAEFFETPNIFIVGDEKQAIYRFQGASVENFLLLRRRWPAMKVVSLDTNYRSHQTILDAGFSMIENNYDENEHSELRVKLKSGNKEKPRPIEIINGDNTSAIEKHLIEDLRSIIGNDTVVNDATTNSSVAIITRRNRDLERVIRLLEAHHIPVSSERSVDIFHHPVGATFFDLIEYMNDPSKIESLARTLATGMWNLSFEDSTKMIRALRSGVKADLDTEIPLLIRLRRKMLNDGAVNFIIEAAEESGFTALVARDPAYIYVWRGIVALAESLARESNIINPNELMKAMLAYRLSAESKTVKVSIGAPDLPVRAMTAHGSKGLEFDYVFLPYATEESWIGRPKGISFILPKKQAVASDTKDIRRLFYVALTRARKHAVVLTAKEESDGKALTPLRFIDELNKGSVKVINLPREHPEISLTSKSETADRKARKNGYSSKITDLAKEVLLSTGLSVTALNHFLQCPNKFLYLSILKLPQAPSAVAEKGTAMHEAISRVWRSKDRTSAAIQATIEQTVDEYFHDSFLPANEKEAVKTELIRNAPIVARAMEPHFNHLGAGTPVVFTERWVKTTFEATADGTNKAKSIHIPIHGKLDAIIESGPDVNVFDYKTRQAMSTNNIKGLTKDSSGDYFRQLVFYRLLLESELKWKGRKITPSLVFVSPDEKGRCPTVTVPITVEDIETIRHQIRSVIDSVWSGYIANSKCRDSECEWCGLRNASRH